MFVDNSKYSKAFLFNFSNVTLEVQEGVIKHNTKVFSDARKANTCISWEKQAVYCDFIKCPGRGKHNCLCLSRVELQGTRNTLTYSSVPFKSSCLL